MVVQTSGTAGHVRVYLARHGQTPLNESGVLRGLADPPLDETGREQASRLGAVLGPRNPSLIVASPLQRAVQTAQPVAGQAGLTVVTDRCLVDRDYGPWTGAPKESVADRWGSVDNAPGVEPALVVLVRAMTGLNAIAGRCRDGAVVAVSHDAVNRQVLAALCPDLGDPDSIPQDNGCFNTLEWRAGTWAVLTVNEIPPASDDTAARLSGELLDDLGAEGGKVTGSAAVTRPWVRGPWQITPAGLPASGKLPPESAGVRTART